MSKYYISTLGCKVNQFESDAIAEALKEKGWQPAATSADADTCIINTCTVTGKASMQSRQIIRQLIRSNPNAKIVVTGCYAQTEAEEIRKIEGVHNIISHSEKHQIPETISAICETNTPSTSADCNSSCRETVFRQIDVDAPGKRTRPFLKIQDGCNAFCTYCIVPHSRGRSRSMSFDDVFEKLKGLGDKGYKEVVLTGIHIGCYGQDLAPRRSFYDLLHAIDKAAPVPRIRLSSIEPREISHDMIKLIANSTVFCNHFHIPLQSGDDEILKRMHRPYDSALFEDLVLRIKELIPDAAIGADTLIGFPGERNGQFENTYNLVKRLPMTYLHVFPYSPREKTPAATYPDQIDPENLKQRCDQMRGLGFSKKSDFLKENTGRKTKVLFEHKRDKKTGLLKGVTSNYLTVLAEGGDELMNRIVEVKTEHAYDSNSLLGKILP